MNKWSVLLANSLWILGCASGLSALSWASFQASTLHTKFRAELNRSAIRWALILSGTLFILGLAGTSILVWEKVAWFLLALLFLAMNVLLARKPETKDEQ